MVASLWAEQPLPESIDINLRLSLRAFQIALADKRNRDCSFLNGDLSRLLKQAQADDKAQMGVFMASGSLATQFFRKDPRAANHYILMALRSASKAVLPDGSRPAIPKEAAIEGMLWGTAIASTSEAEVEDWLETVGQLGPEQVRVLSESALAEDNSTVFCDSVWLREYRKPEKDRNWEPVEGTLRLIEGRARNLGLDLLNAAAVRTQIVILAEWRNQLPQAVAVAEKVLRTAASDGVRFLIEEVTGRQLAYAGRWEEALRWMGRALERDVRGFAILRRNLLVTVGEGVARYNLAAACQFSRQAVDVAKSASLEPVRIAEALGEYAIALWGAGQREKAFTQWQEAVQTLVRSVGEHPSYAQTFVAFLHAGGYFGNMALLDRPPNAGYSAPEQGFFLALDRIPVEKPKPIQKSLLYVHTAMFAEGVQDTEAAGRWAGLALDNGPEETGHEVLRPFIWLAVAPAVLAGGYRDAVERARSVSAAGSAPSEDSLEALNVKPESRSRIRGIFLDPRRTELSLMFGVVPLAFRLATIRFERDVSTEVEDIRKHIETFAGAGAAEWREAAGLMKSILSDGKPWRTLHAEAEVHYRESHWSLGILCFLGSILSAPERQSLATQIVLARDLGKLFKANPSIRFKIIQPFFERYWNNAITSGSTDFRTAAAYTRRRFDEAVSNPVSIRLKSIFKSMVFCVGLPLPSDQQDWLDEEE